MHQRNLQIPAIEILKCREYLAPKKMTIVFYFTENLYNLVISSVTEKDTGLFTKFLQVSFSVALKIWSF